MIPSGPNTKQQTWFLLEPVHITLPSAASVPFIGKEMLRPLQTGPQCDLISLWFWVNSWWPNSRYVVHHWSLCSACCAPLWSIQMHLAYICRCKHLQHYLQSSLDSGDEGFIYLRICMHICIDQSKGPDIQITYAIKLICTSDVPNANVRNNLFFFGSVHFPVKRMWGK